MVESQKKLLIPLIIMCILCLSIFSYTIYNLYESYQLSNNRDYEYHLVCINNHLYIRMIPRLGITPVFDRQYTEPKLIQCSVKDGKIIYDDDAVLLLNNQ